MSLEIRLAQPRDFPAIGRMLELYQYELSDIWDQELDSQGEYRYDLSKHQIGKQFFAYVLLVNSSYAGLALVAPAMVTRKEGCWMEQFFVLKKHRKGGNGQALASYVFKAHPGFWEVGQMPANAAARQFWLRIIDQATSGKFEEVVVQQGWWQGTVQRFSVDVAV